VKPLGYLVGMMYGVVVLLALVLRGAALFWWLVD